MKIHVLGTGCTKCKKLYAEAEAAVARSAGDIELLKVERVEEIMKFGVPFTPALIIDGEVKTVGKVPDAAQITAWIAQRAVKE